MFAAALVSEIASEARVAAIWRGQFGVEVPMPTLFDPLSYTNPVVSIVKPPAKVEVADVEVAIRRDP